MTDPYFPTVDFNYLLDARPPDGRWLPGRGSRIFPDQRNKSDHLRNQAILKIHAAPGMAQGNKVYLRAFDVDDATPESFDEDHKIDTDRSGNDNKDTDPTRAKSGQFIVGGQRMGSRIELPLDVNGDASVIFETTIQPGDNFWVALAFENVELNFLQVTAPHFGGGFVEGNSFQQPRNFSGGIVSPMLTVWRKLNVEVDSMDKPPTFYGPDKLRMIGREWVLNAPKPGQSVLHLDSAGLGVLMPPSYDFYEGGTITAGETTLEIARSSQGGVVVNLLPTAEQQADFIGKQVILKDDDLENLPIDLLPILPRYNLINNRVIKKFIPAYILLRDASTPEENPRKLIPFRTNESLDRGTSLNDLQDLKDSEGYWAHLVVAAYQPGPDDDGDPVSELKGGSGDKGLTRRAGGISAIYLETIRDNHTWGLSLLNPKHRALNQQNVRDDIDETVVHEIGHGTPRVNGIKHHDELGSMQESGGSIVDTFTPLTINRFRTIKSWTTLR